MPPPALCALAALVLCTLCAGKTVEHQPLAAGPAPSAPADAAPLLRQPRAFASRAARARGSYQDREELVRSARSYAVSVAAPGPDWSFKPIQVNVDVGKNTAGTVPLVVVPVPVPQLVMSSGCDANSGKKITNVEEFEDVSQWQRSQPTSPRRPAPWTARPTYNQYDNNEFYNRKPTRRPLRPVTRYPSVTDQRFDEQHDQMEEDIPQSEPIQPRPEPPQTYEPDVTVEPTSPHVERTVSSQQLIEEFRAQRPKAPELPPMLLSGFDGSERAPISDENEAVKEQPVTESFSANLPQSETLSKTAPVQNAVSNARPSTAARRDRDPPRPRFDNLHMLRGQLIVPRADYSEPYAIWYDQSTGASRIDFHGGATSTFRTIMPDGRVQKAEVRVDRSTADTMRRCAVATSSASNADRGHPALPDLQQFSFGGYEETEGGRVEVWRRSVSARAGEQGGARGEALTTRHELRLARLAGDAAVPLRYTVAVDSSALGPDCDGYEHFYQLGDAQPMDSKFFNVDLVDLCDSMEQLNASSADDVARLEPLREFTLPHRDLRHDEIFKRFKVKYERQYVDEKEEAVRKNLLMQSTRFIASGNREGATAELGENFLADRLAAEVRRLQGAEPSAERAPAEPFPHSRDQLRAQERRLPSGFDWRARGGVTPVRYQGSCSSCWAFAVVASVEGALFRRTRRLVALSEQCLVDCAHPYGGKGCKGTWPSHAFNYVEARGLPAREEYPEYKDKVDKCVDESVPSQTRISSHVNVTSNSVPALKVAIRRHAPSVVIVDADCKSFLFYKKGVLYDDRCGKVLKQLHHAVVAVGWGEQRGEPYFILKNSWSAAWGDGGYVRVQARSNTCGVLTKPSYPRLEDADVAKPLRKGQRRVLRTSSSDDDEYFDYA